MGNLAIIYTTCKHSEEIIVLINIHKPIFHGLELVGTLPIFVSPEWAEHTQTAGHIAHTIKEALLLYPRAKAVILTYPTYYGVTTSNGRNAPCDAYPVLVDEVHWAHAYSKFPQSALKYGTVIVVQSTHEILPAMTMGAFLHVKSTLVNIEKVKSYLRILQWSSPSYLLLAS